MKKTIVKLFTAVLFFFIPLMLPAMDLFEAATKGNTGFISSYIKSGGNINITDNSTETALMLAARFGHADCVKLLIEAKADINAKDNGDCTALMYAADSGNAESVKLLIDAKVKNVNAKSRYGKTALMCAAQSGLTDCVKLLIEARATVNAKDNGDWTALMYASLGTNYIGNADAVKALISAGANVNAKNNAGQIALMCAAGLGNADAVKALISAGANVNAKDNGYRTALMSAADSGNADCIKLLIDAKVKNVNAKDEIGFTALMYAADSGNSEIVKLLIDVNADVNAKDLDDDTALMYAITSKKNPAECVKLLLAAGADFKCKNSLYNRLNFYGTALEIAEQMVGESSYENNPGIDIVRLLIGAGEVENIYNAAIIGDTNFIKSYIKKGKNINDKYYFKGVLTTAFSSPLIVAASLGRADCVRLFIDAGANLNETNLNGTALFHAVLYNHPDCLKLLIGAEADPYIGPDPLSAASENGYSDCMKLLINPASIKKFGTDALCGARNVDCLKLLVDAGADVNGVNKDGLRPLVYFSTSSLSADSRILNYIIKSGADVKKYGGEALTRVFSYNLSKHPGPSSIHIETPGQRYEEKEMTEKEAEEFAEKHPLWNTREVIDDDRFSAPMVKLLLIAGADPNYRDKSGKCVMDLAEDHIAAYCMSLLAGAGAKKAPSSIYFSGGITLPVKNINNSEDIFLAGIINDTGFIDSYIKSGGDVNALDFYGDTALIRASEYNNKDCIKKLLNAGADPNIANQLAKTALLYAQQNKDDETVSLLKNAGATNTILPGF